MGIGSGRLADYVSWAAKGWLRPGAAVFEIGAQQLAPDVTTGDIERFVAAYGGTPFPRDEMPRPGDFAGTLFERAGFSYASADIKPLPFAATLDLNLDELPADHFGRYDLVTNEGTSEHILNQWNVMKVMHDAARPGGLVYHAVPLAGQFEHGIVSYNPKFFWALAEANGYRIIDFYGFNGPVRTMPESILAQIRFNSVPHASKSAICVLFRKPDDRRFAGLRDPAFA